MNVCGGIAAITSGLNVSVLSPSIVFAKKALSLSFVSLSQKTRSHSCSHVAITSDSGGACSVPSMPRRPPSRNEGIGVASTPWKTRERSRMLKT